MTSSPHLEEKDYLYVCKKCADLELWNEKSKAKLKPEVHWRCGFRIEFDGNEHGKLMDREIGWKPIPIILPDEDDYFPNDVGRFFTQKNSAHSTNGESKEFLHQKRRIYVQLPEAEEPEERRLYRFIQPLILCRALKAKRRKVTGTQIENIRKVANLRNAKRKKIADEKKKELEAVILKLQD